MDYKFASRQLKFLLAGLGILSAIVTIFTTSGGVSSVAKILTGVFLIGAAVWTVVDLAFRQRRAKRALPGVDMIEDVAGAYSIASAKPEDIRWISRRAQRIYSGIDIIPESIMLEWHSANPNGFYVIKSRSGHRVGNVDILPMKPGTLEHFVSGELIEREIRGDCLYQPGESDRIRDLYIESFVATSDELHPNAAAAVHVISNFPGILENICDLRKVDRILALGASENGKRLLSRLGFDVIREGNLRRDDHDLYSARFIDVARNIVQILGNRVQSKRIVDLLATLEGEIV